MNSRNNKVENRNKSHRARDLVDKRGVPVPQSICSPKIPWWRAPYVTARCHGAKSPCWGIIMASHNKPAVSDIPKLGDTIFG
jgi:hypothetical protein